MDLFQFAIGLIITLIGVAIIISPELATIIAAVLIILGLVAAYDAVYGTKSWKYQKDNVCLFLFLQQVGSNLVNVNILKGWTISIN